MENRSLQVSSGCNELLTKHRVQRLVGLINKIILELLIHWDISENMILPLAGLDPGTF